MLLSFDENCCALKMQSLKLFSNFEMQASRSLLKAHDAISGNGRGKKLKNKFFRLPSYLKGPCANRGRLWMQRQTMDSSTLL